MSKSFRLIGVIASVALITACKTAQTDTPPATASEAGSGTTAGSSGSGGAGGTGSGSSVPTLISVNLQNVLNDLSVSLQVNQTVSR